MATKLKGSIEREVHSKMGRELIVRITAEGIYAREKGRRSWFGPLGWGSVYGLTAEMAAAETRKGRRARKVSRGLLTT